ncbi:vacuolar protein sorting-associated protein 16B isoform X2 [Bacillus rossius redtenbacheri]|uniref:vacuolar protein sorting-associated protein 16B isoform X2 n=1 Tax=Bacillus rossius redtenbacheri TaxID=93214 RepID=UPI002FDCEADB
MAVRVEEDEDYWHESETKAFNFEEDEFGSQLCGVSRSGAARLSQQVRAGIGSVATPLSTDSLAGTFSKATVLDDPEVVKRPLHSLISEEALQCILDFAAHRQRPLVARGAGVEEQLRMLRRQVEGRWTPPPVDVTIKKLLLGQPYSLELYRSKASKTDLLDAAVKLGDGNAILAIVLFLVKTLKKSLVYQLLRTRPTAVAQYANYLATRLQVHELADLLQMVGQTKEAAMKQFQLAVKATQNPQLRLRKLRACLNNHFNDPDLKDRIFIDNYIKLIEWQLAEAGTDGELCRSLVGQPVLGSLAHCCRQHWGEPRGSPGSPLTLAQQHGVCDRQFQWTALNVRAAAQAWEDVRGLFITKSWLGSRKLKSAIPAEKVVECLHSYNAPDDVLMTYLEMIDSLEKRMMVARKIKCHKAVIDRDRQALISYKANLNPQSEDYFYAENALKASTTKWRN